MNKIFVICPYERWSKHWFKELVTFYHSQNKSIAADIRKRVLRDGRYEIQFIGKATSRLYEGIRHDSEFIYWNGDNVEELFAKIEGAKLWLVSNLETTN